MQIIDLRAEDQDVVEQAAELLVVGFRDHAPAAWPDMTAALEEVQEACAAGKIARVALDLAGKAVGWIGGNSRYGGNVWELHPLVVHPAHQRQGIGRALVIDLEALVRARGGLTITLGTDDEANMTSLSGRDLYPNVLEQAIAIRNLRGHPYEFYQQLGYVITGVLPDANGFGRPDIFMSKRVANG
ncbi:MAG: GNAT family N-acetyltransferase [Caldilineaceae bacterium]